MSSEIIKKHLEEMKKQNNFDADFIDVLIVSNDKNEEGKETFDKILNLIKKRYAENKENNS